MITSFTFLTSLACFRLWEDTGVPGEKPHKSHDFVLICKFLNTKLVWYVWVFLAFRGNGNVFAETWHPTLFEGWLSGH